MRMANEDIHFAAQINKRKQEYFNDIWFRHGCEVRQHERRRHSAVQLFGMMRERQSSKYFSLPEASRRKLATSILALWRNREQQIVRFARLRSMSLGEISEGAPALKRAKEHLVPDGRSNETLCAAGVQLF